MLAGLIRNGRGLLRSGRGLLASLGCRATCCGCYTRFSSCRYRQGGVPLPGQDPTTFCITQEMDQDIFVSPQALNDLRERGCLFQGDEIPDPPGTPPGTNNVLFYNGRCYYYNGCDFADPLESADCNPFDILHGPPWCIPAGSPIIRSADEVDCLEGCADTRCFDALWIVAQECEGNPNHMDRPVYVCARSVLACATIRVTNDQGLHVCMIVNPANTLDNDHVDPGGLFIVFPGLAYGGICCHCLETVPESTCAGVEVSDTPNPCYPWYGTRRCCCNPKIDRLCVDQYLARYIPVSPDIIGRGYTRFVDVPVCTVPGAVNQMVLHTVYPDLPDADFDSTAPIPDPSCPINLTPLIDFGDLEVQFSTNLQCSTNMPNSAYMVTTQYITEQSCTEASIRIRATQYNSPDLAPIYGPLRAYWEFDMRIRLDTAGNPCGGGCGGTTPLATNQPISHSRAIGGCAGCGGEGGVAA